MKKERINLIDFSTIIMFLIGISTAFSLGISPLLNSPIQLPHILFAIFMFLIGLLFLALLLNLLIISGKIIIDFENKEILCPVNAKLKKKSFRFIVTVSYELSSHSISNGICFNLISGKVVKSTCYYCMYSKKRTKNKTNEIVKRLNEIIRLHKEVKK